MLKYIRTITIVASFLLAIYFLVTKTTNQQELSYWIWAGRTVDPTIPLSSILYIHQGTIIKNRKNKKLIFERQGLGPIDLNSRPIYLVYRIESLESLAPLIKIFDVDQQRWSNKGNLVLGLQLDFDSPSHKLDLYYKFLSRVRLELDKKFKLSITGLADWASSAPDEFLKKIIEVSDELIFQLYEGKSAIPNLNSYLTSISKINLPFKLGVLENQRQVLQRTFRHSNLKGYVVFY